MGSCVGTWHETTFPLMPPSQRWRNGWMGSKSSEPEYVYSCGPHTQIMRDTTIAWINHTDISATAKQLCGWSLSLNCGQLIISAVWWTIEFTRNLGLYREYNYIVRHMPIEERMWNNLGCLAENEPQWMNDAANIVKDILLFPSSVSDLNISLSSSTRRVPWNHVLMEADDGE